MASKNKPSIYSDRGDIGSTKELDEYGVWVKSEPQVLSADSSNHTETEIFENDDISGIKEPGDSDNFEDLDFNDDDINIDINDDQESMSINIEDSGISIEDTSFDNLKISGELANDDFGIPTVKSIENNIGNIQDDFTTAVKGKEGDLSTQLLLKIANELSSIRGELQELKKEFSVVRPHSKEEDDETIALTGDELDNIIVTTEDSPQETEKQGFFTEEEDDTISLTGDELDNIVNTSDFTEEPGTNETPENDFPLDDDSDGLSSDLSLDDSPQEPADIDIMEDEPLGFPADDLSEPSDNNNAIDDLNMDSLGMDDIDLADEFKDDNLTDDIAEDSTTGMDLDSGEETFESDAGLQEASEEEILSNDTELIDIDTDDLDIDLDPDTFFDEQPSSSEESTNEEFADEEFAITEEVSSDTETEEAADDFSGGEIMGIQTGDAIDIAGIDTDFDDLDISGDTPLSLDDSALTDDPLETDDSASLDIPEDDFPSIEVVLPEEDMISLDDSALTDDPLETDAPVSLDIPEDDFPPIDTSLPEEDPLLSLDDSPLTDDDPLETDDSVSLDIPEDDFPPIDTSLPEEDEDPLLSLDDSPLTDDDPLATDDSVSLDIPEDGFPSIDTSLPEEDPLSLDDALTDDSLAIDEPVSLDIPEDDFPSIDTSLPEEDPLSLDDSALTDDSLAIDEPVSLDIPEDDFPSIDTSLPEEDPLSLDTSLSEDDITVDFDETRDDDELKKLRDEGAKQVTFPPENSSYLEDADSFDLSESVDEPEMSADITEPLPEDDLGIDSFDDLTVDDVQIPSEEEVTQVISETSDDDFDVGATADDLGVESFDDTFDIEEPQETPAPAVKSEPVIQPKPAQTAPTPQRGGKSGFELPSALKSELRNILSYMDQLLESLPEKKIEEFAKSEYFDSYKKLFKDLGLV